MIRRLVYSFAALALLAAPAAPAPIVEGHSRGTLVLEGGGRAAEGFAEQVVAALSGEGPLCVITTAMDGLAHGAETGRFAGLGAAVQVLDIDPGNIDDPAELGRLRACSGYYFTGGDPERLSTVWRPHGIPSTALHIVRQRYAEAGAVVSGSSAGAMIAGDVTLCECGARSSVQALLDNRLFEAEGFGLVEDVLVDAHFFARGLLGRHLWQMVNRGHPVGVGIDEATAVIVPGDGGPWEVIGERGVALIRQIGPGNGGQPRFLISLLAPGDRFVPATGEVTVAAGRDRLPPAAGAAALPLEVAEIFAPDAVPLLLIDLLSGPARHAVGRAADGSIKLVFEETRDTRAFADDRHTTVLDVALTLEVRE